MELPISLNTEILDAVVVLMNTPTSEGSQVTWGMIVSFIIFIVLLAKLSEKS